MRKSFTIDGPNSLQQWVVRDGNNSQTLMIGTMPEATAFIEREYERKSAAKQVSIAIPGATVTGLPGKYRVRAYHGSGIPQTVLDCTDLAEATWAARCLIEGIDYVPKAWQR